MNTLLMVVLGWVTLSIFFGLVIWPRWANVAIPKDQTTIVKCKMCGHVQRCCAPPCERCQSMDVQII